MQFWAPAPDPLAAIIEPNSVSDPPAASTPSPVPPAELPATVTFASTAGSEARIPPPPHGGPAAPLGLPSPPPPSDPARLPDTVEFLTSSRPGSPPGATVAIPPPSPPAPPRPPAVAGVAFGSPSPPPPPGPAT